ncbi:uncharacterized protein CC84DRAFT_745017 [Paraphaeosphaeria sporulosa]|uniref:Uncharacterized protein n=1 Tax=Paraphaeosphaeria sporulosa TaxID=1460663 RepID=A0A177CGU6_9PLEO|nr:uncharacterized protein CC84DRAFT_745017 [Paraphaeosphaeria sporulosa]OAG06069.1 hypothetical protein CC84DRAFT_745017 [Paraphaeosphaeria sporulosa]
MVFRSSNEFLRAHYGEVRGTSPTTAHLPARVRAPPCSSTRRVDAIQTGGLAHDAYLRLVFSSTMSLHVRRQPRMFHLYIWCHGTSPWEAKMVVMFFSIGLVCYTLEGLFWVTIYAHHSGRVFVLLHLLAFCLVFTRWSRGVTKTGWDTFHTFASPTVVTRIIFIAAIFTIAPRIFAVFRIALVTSLLRSQSTSTARRIHEAPWYENARYSVCLFMAGTSADMGRGPRFWQPFAFACTTRGIASQPLHPLQLGPRTL